MSRKTEFTVAEFQANMSWLIARVEDGEDLVIVDPSGHKVVATSAQKYYEIVDQIQGGKIK